MGFALPPYSRIHFTTEPFKVEGNVQLWIYDSGKASVSVVLEGGMIKIKLWRFERYGLDRIYQDVIFAIRNSKLPFPLQTHAELVWLGWFLPPGFRFNDNRQLVASQYFPEDHIIENVGDEDDPREYILPEIRMDCGPHNVQPKLGNNGEVQLKVIRRIQQGEVFCWSGLKGRPWDTLANPPHQ